MIVIIGVDPGLARTGWGVINKDGNQLKYLASGVIATDANERIELRLGQIFTELSAVLLKYQPVSAALEETFVNVNSQSSLKLAHARGAIMVALAQGGLAVDQYAPNLVKKSVVGYGRAEKDQIIHMVNLLLPSSNVKLVDEADALAVAICHSGHLVFSGVKNVR